MCRYTRYSMRAVRCTAAKSRSHEWPRQEHSRCQSTGQWSRVPLLSASCCPASSVSPSAELQYGSISPPAESWPPGRASDDIAIAEQASRRFAACAVEAPRVWIHIQDFKQKSLADAVNRSLAVLMVDGAAVSPQPVQWVQEGPMVDQIRYFKAGDRTGALAIVQSLRLVLPRLWLEDMSATYDQVMWIKPGNYELWLAPGDRSKDH